MSGNENLKTFSEDIYFLRFVDIFKEIDWTKIIIKVRLVTMKTTVNGANGMSQSHSIHQCIK